MHLVVFRPMTSNIHLTQFLVKNYNANNIIIQIKECSLLQYLMNMKYYPIEFKKKPNLKFFITVILFRLWNV